MLPQGSWWKNCDFFKGCILLFYSSRISRLQPKIPRFSLQINLLLSLWIRSWLLNPGLFFSGQGLLIVKYSKTWKLSLFAIVLLVVEPTHLKSEKYDRFPQNRVNIQKIVWNHHLVADSVHHIKAHIFVDFVEKRLFQFPLASWKVNPALKWQVSQRISLLKWWVHPGRSTWNLQITHLERKIIFQTSMIMFHVNLQGCRSQMWFRTFYSFYFRCFNDIPLNYPELQNVDCSFKQFANIDIRANTMGLPPKSTKNQEVLPVRDVCKFLNPSRMVPEKKTTSDNRFPNV